MVLLKKILWIIQTLFGFVFYGSIGYLSYIGSPKYIIGGSKLYIGKRVRILYNFRCEIHKNGVVRIGDSTSIGHNCHISSCELLVIGTNATISSNVFLGSLDHTFDIPNTHVMNQPLSCIQTTVGDFCFIGTGAVILAGTNIGKNCVVGANSVVKGSFPDYSIIAGNPAKTIGFRKVI
jgi:acetyltransferase-like isoleucine patch superfamily enzyme